jgi:hypothetical protein
MFTGAFEDRIVDGRLYVSLMECLENRSISCVASMAIYACFNCSDYVGSNDTHAAGKRDKLSNQHLICFRGI